MSNNNNSNNNGNNNNMSVTAEAIIALVGVVLALPPCVVIVWKWRLIRGAMRSSASASVPVEEAPETATTTTRAASGSNASCLSLGTGLPLLPLHHHGKRAMTGTSTATTASSITDVSCRAPSTTISRASSATTIAVPEGEEGEGVDASSTELSSSRETDTPSSLAGEATSSFPTTTTSPGMTTKNLFLKEDGGGDGGLGSSPHRVELFVIEGKVHSVQLLCRNSFSPLFRIPGYPYSLESPV